MGVSISEFRGEYYFLSNFYSAPVTYNGMCFENNEAAFQAAKCPERMTESSSSRCVSRQMPHENPRI